MTDYDELFLVDSNILFYAFEHAEGFKNKIAKEIINACWKGNTELVISAQNLAEFVYATTSKAKLDFEQVKIAVDFIMSFEGFVKLNYKAKTILSAIDIANEFKMSFWDSLIAATMKENGIFNIYTENTNDFKMPWINVVNPFR